VQLEQALTRAVQAGGNDLVGIETPELRQGHRADAGDLLGRPEGQMLAQPVDGRRIDAVLDQSVQQALQPLAPWARDPGRLLKGIGSGRTPASLLALHGRVDAPIDALQAFAEADAHPPARSDADFPRTRLELKAMDQCRAASRPGQQLDDADHPPERALAVLPQYPHPPRLDPFVGTLLSDLDLSGLAALDKGPHAADRLVTGLVPYRCKPDRSVEPIGIGDQRPELPRRRFQLPSELELEDPPGIAVGQSGMDRQVARFAVEQGLEVAQHRPGVDKPILGLLGQGSLDHPRDPIADAWVQGRKARGRLVAVLRAKGIPRLRRERRPAGQEMKQGGAHRVNVGPRIDGTPRPLLRRHVVRCSQQRAGGGHGQ